MMHQLIGKGWLNTVEFLGQAFRTGNSARNGSFVESQEWKHSRSKRRFTLCPAHHPPLQRKLNAVKANGT